MKIIILTIAVIAALALGHSSTALTTEELEELKIIKHDRETKVQLNVLKRTEAENSYDSYRRYVNGLDAQLEKGRTFNKVTNKDVEKILEQRLQQDLDNL